MPQIVPVSDFRANITSVSQFTDSGEVVILTQNGRPRWAMVDYDEWNAASQAQERAYARAILEAEALEEAGKATYLSTDEFKARRRQRLASMAENGTA